MQKLLQAARLHSSANNSQVIADTAFAPPSLLMLEVEDMAEGRCYNSQYAPDHLIFPRLNPLERFCTCSSSSAVSSEPHVAAQLRSLNDSPFQFLRALKCIHALPLSASEKSADLRDACMQSMPEQFDTSGNT